LRELAIAQGFRVRLRRSPGGKPTGDHRRVATQYGELELELAGERLPRVGAAVVGQRTPDFAARSQRISAVTSERAAERQRIAFRRSSEWQLGEVRSLCGEHRGGDQGAPGIAGRQLVEREVELWTARPGEQRERQSVLGRERVAVVGERAFESASVIGRQRMASQGAARVRVGHAGRQPFEQPERLAASAVVGGE
jgi:hypothetical protein